MNSAKKFVLSNVPRGRKSPVGEPLIQCHYELQNSDSGDREKNRLPRPVGIAANDPVRPPEEDACHRDVQRVLHGYPGIDGREGVPQGEEDESADDQRIEFDLRFFVPSTPKEKDYRGKHQQPEDPEPYREKLPGIDDGNQEEK